MLRFPLVQLIVWSSLFCTSAALAQINVSTPTQNVQIGKDGRVRVDNSTQSSTSGSGNEARTRVGEIDADANIEGITIINERVYIDGKEVPAGTTRYKSPKTGKTYLIDRKSGSVSVSEAGGRP